MEKPKANYPLMPPQMNPVGPSSSYHGEHSMAAPPSYDQAVTPGYPPVEVMHPSPHHIQSHGAQVYVATAPNAPYIGVATDGMPINTQPSYPVQHSTAPHPMVQQPVVIVHQQQALLLGPEPAFVLCPACNVHKFTRVTHEPCSKTHLLAALLCVFGFWCCACIPYMVDSCKSSNHYCGNCNKFLGTYGNSL